MSCVNDKLTLMPKGFYPSSSCVGPTPYCPPGLSKHYKCGRTCGGSDWRVDPPLYYASKSAALEDGACYLAENGVCAPGVVQVPGARTVERPQPSCSTVREQQQQQRQPLCPSRAGSAHRVPFIDKPTVDSASNLEYPTVPSTESKRNNDASNQSATAAAEATSQVMGDSRPDIVASGTIAINDVGAVAAARQARLRRTQGLSMGKQPYGGVYPWVPPSHTQPPCPVTTAPGPPASRARDELPCGQRYTHDGYRASCGRYNYGAGTARGGCGGYAGQWGEAGYGCEVAKTGCGTACPPNEFTYDGWTEVGEVMNTDAYPITDYLTKSCTRCDADPFLRCQFGECTGCHAQANPLDRGDDGQGGSGGDYLPQPSSMNLENKFHHQRRASAFERPTMWTNAGIGYGPFGNAIGGPRCGSRKNSQLGWNYGTLHATGCKCRRCSQDPFYHTRTTITTPNVSRKYRLFARRSIVCNSAQLSSSRLEYAVAPAGVVDPTLTVLPGDPRQPKGDCYYASNCGVDYQERAWVELKSGDRVYLPGERGSYEVHLWADDAGPYRQNASVFRNWGPVRRLPGRVRRHYSNSGLRNFSGTPSANALLRPW